MSTVKVQSTGQITLPAKIRQQANLKTGDLLSVDFCGKNEIVLTFEKTSEPIHRSVLPISEKGWEWLNHFEVGEQNEFLIELFCAIKEATAQGNWEPLVQLIEEWKATANINAHPDVVRSIENAEAELAQGKGISWAALRKELDL